MELLLETAYASSERASYHPHLNEEFQKIKDILKTIITCTTVPCTIDNRCLLQCQVDKAEGMLTSLHEDLDELKNLVNKYLDIFLEPRFREYYYQEKVDDVDTPVNYPSHVQEGVGMYFVRDKRKLKKICVEMEGIYNKLHFKHLEVKGTVIRPPARPKLKDLAIGDPVTCRFYIKDQNQWTMEYYNATIKRVNQSSNTFDIRYDTGERVNDVPRNYIRYLKEPIPVEKKDDDEPATNKFTQDPAEAVAKLQNAIGQVTFDQMKKDKAILHALSNIMLLSDDGDSESNNSNLLLGRAKACELVLAAISPITGTNDTILNYACRVIRSLTNGCADNKARFRSFDIFNFLDDIIIAQNASQQTKDEATLTRKQLIAANGPQFREGQLVHASTQYKVLDGRYTANFETMKNDKSSWSSSSLDKSLEEHSFGDRGFIHPHHDPAHDRKQNAILRRYQVDRNHIHVNGIDHDEYESLKIAKLKGIPTFDSVTTVNGAMNAFNMIDSFKDQLAAQVACNAISCTRRLCNDKKLRGELLNAGAFGSIVQTGNRFLDAVDVIIITTKAISDISMNDDSRTALSKAGACELMVKFMANYLFSSTICMYASCSVYNMAYQHDDNKIHLGKIGACEAILTIFVHQAEISKVEQWVCYGIGSLAHGNEFNKRRLHASDVEDYLVKIVKRISVLDPTKPIDNNEDEESDPVENEKQKNKKKLEVMGLKNDNGKLLDSAIFACRHISHLSGTICTKLIRLGLCKYLIACLDKFGMKPVLNLNGIIGMHSCSKDIVSNSMLTLRSLLSTANNDVEVARKDSLEAGVLDILIKLLKNINANSDCDYVLQKYIVWIIKLFLEGDSKRFITATSSRIGKVTTAV